MWIVGNWNRWPCDSNPWHNITLKNKNFCKCKPANLRVDNFDSCPYVNYQIGKHMVPGASCVQWGPVREWMARKSVLGVFANYVSAVVFMWFLSRFCVFILNCTCCSLLCQCTWFASHSWVFLILMRLVAVFLTCFKISPLTILPSPPAKSTRHNSLCFSRRCPTTMTKMCPEQIRREVGWGSPSTYDGVGGLQFLAVLGWMPHPREQSTVAKYWKWLVENQVT